jgi:hypothetical protein
MGFIHLQIEWNTWLGGHLPQIPVLSALYPHLYLLNPPEKNSWGNTPPPNPKQFLGTPLVNKKTERIPQIAYVMTVLHIPIFESPVAFSFISKLSVFRY